MSANDWVVFCSAVLVLLISSAVRGGILAPGPPAADRGTTVSDNKIVTWLRRSVSALRAHSTFSIAFPTYVSFAYRVRSRREFTPALS